MTAYPSMQSLVQSYLEERRSAGFALEIPGKLLMGFALLSDQRCHRGPMTEQLIMDWVQGRAKRATPFTWARRLQVIRPFAKYCFRLDRAAYIPEQNIFGPEKRRLTPHIYSDREIVDLLRAASRLPPEGTLRPATYRTLLGLIAATGLRLPAGHAAGSAPAITGRMTRASGPTAATAPAALNPPALPASAAGYPDSVRDRGSAAAG